MLRAGLLHVPRWARRGHGRVGVGLGSLAVPPRCALSTWTLDVSPSSTRIATEYHKPVWTTEFEQQGRARGYRSGKLANLAERAVEASDEGTTVLTTVVGAQVEVGAHSPLPTPRAHGPWGVQGEGNLMVEYREKAYAGGRIPSTFNRREGGPNQREILVPPPPPHAPHETRRRAAWWIGLFGPYCPLAWPRTCSWCARCSPATPGATPRCWPSTVRPWPCTA